MIHGASPAPPPRLPPDPATRSVVAAPSPPPPILSPSKLLQRLFFFFSFSHAGAAATPPYRLLLLLLLFAQMLFLGVLRLGPAAFSGSSSSSFTATTTTTTTTTTSSSSSLASSHHNLSSPKEHAAPDIVYGASKGAAGTREGPSTRSSLAATGVGASQQQLQQLKNTSGKAERRKSRKEEEEEEEEEGGRRKRRRNGDLAMAEEEEGESRRWPSAQKAVTTTTTTTTTTSSSSSSSSSEAAAAAATTATTAEEEASTTSPPPSSSSPPPPPPPPPSPPPPPPPPPPSSAAAATTDGCGDGYIYVYKLPAMFNEGIVANCSGLSRWGDMCGAVANGGKGRRLGGAWYETDQFAAEMLFHERMRGHRCRTRDWRKAAALYVPYYAGLDVGRHLWSGRPAAERDAGGDRLLSWLARRPSWRRRGGRDHFLAVGRITWDFRRLRDDDWWGSGLFHRPAMANVTRLPIERSPWDAREVGVPYPTGFHPRGAGELRAWQSLVLARPRPALFAFAGAPRARFPADFRGLLFRQCIAAGAACRLLDCSNRSCEPELPSSSSSSPSSWPSSSSAPDLPLPRSLPLFLSSSFCLQPRGDSFTRRSTFECLLAGSIPVFFWRRSAYSQYPWHLPPDPSSYSVFIPAADLRRSNGTLRIADVLSAIPAHRVRSLRDTVVRLVLPRIVYASSSSSLPHELPDAVEVAVRGVLRSFRTGVDPASSVDPAAAAAAELRCR